ncbi:elongation factor G [Winogradskyella schleiferi]|uniref:elongation factor G n=1 Tax=Winogradskyella schleiferi TaxID=2686078 RepID=UPI0015BBCD5D|nr:elongation factor G [Winogradskyella schleiferi]
MKVFDNKHIKNVAFVGTHRAGKTTLSETMLFEAGLINRRGTVEQQNTVSDYHEFEHQRGASVFSTPLHTEWRNYKINIIDTPGLDDYIGEIISSIRVADTIVTVINAKHGADIGTEIIWNYVDRYHKPTLFVINKIDSEKANFETSVKSLQALVGNNAVLVQYPIKLDGAQCIVDVLKMKCYKFGPEGGKPEKLEIPEDQLEYAKQLQNELVEKAAENDEELMELYFDKGTLNEDELRQGIKMGMLNHDLFPIFCVSALNDMGSGRLMGFIDNVAPSASDLNPEQTIEGDLIKSDVNADASLFVFKNIYQPNLGQITFFKVMSGQVKVNDKLFNTRTGESETLNQLYIMDGRQKHSVQKLNAGDIGATTKLKYTETNDTLATHAEAGTIKPIKFPQPRLVKTVFAETATEEEKLSDALRSISSQDLTINLSYNNETHQTLIGTQGELHLATLNWLLEHVYDVKVKFEAPKISYRETIQRSATANYRHKKQSGGSGQFGQVHLKIEPYYEGMPEPEGFSLRGKEVVDLPWDGKLVFYNCIVGGVIDQRYLPSIMKGILEVMESGPLTDSYIRDVRVMVYDGKMHAVDSNDISFKIAGSYAFKDAFLNANPKLLEPTVKMQLRVPEQMIGGVMTELQSRRALIQGIETEAHFQILNCTIPSAELTDFSSQLRSLTQGRATYSSRFDSYSAVPNHIQKQLVKEKELITT